MYQKAADVLAANRTQLDDATFEFFATRSSNGLTQASTAYWAQEFRRLKDKYNKTTEGGMTPEEIRRTIQSGEAKIHHSIIYCDDADVVCLACPLTANACYPNLTVADHHTFVICE